MFRVYGEGDIIRAGDGFDSDNPFIHIEALQNNDFIHADDFNRAIKNIYQNQAETYEMLKAFSLSSLDASYIPNNNDTSKDNSFKILSTNLNKVTLQQVGGGTVDRYYLSIPQGVASQNGSEKIGVIVHKIMAQTIERQIKSVLTLTDKRESVVIKVQDNAGTGNSDRVMCKITKVISNTPTEIFFPTACSTTFDLNDFTNFYYNSVQLLADINNYNTLADFRGLLLQSSGGFENFKGQQIINLTASTDYDIYLNTTTGFATAVTTPTERDPTLIYLAQVNITSVPVITVTDLRKNLSAPLGLSRIPTQEPMIYLSGSFTDPNVPRNESENIFSLSSYLVTANTVTLYGKSMYYFSGATSYIQNETVFPSANGSVLGIGFYLKPAGTAATAHLVGIADTTVNDTFDVHLNYNSGYYNLSGSTKLNYEIYVNGKRNYESFTSNDIVYVYINFTSTNAPPIAGLIFGKTTHGSNTDSPVGMMIGEIRVYDDLPFDVNYIKGLYTLGNIYTNKKYVTFDNLEILGTLTASNISYNEYPAIRGLKSGLNISYIPSDDANPKFKISTGNIHIRDGSELPYRDTLATIIDDEDFNEYASITLRPSISGQINNITIGNISCSEDGQYVLIAGNDNYVYVSNDSGSTWKRTTLATGAYIVTMEPSGEVMLAALYGGKIWRSIDYGSTWAELAASSIKNWNSIECTIDSGYIVAGTIDEYVYTSEDAGTNWDVRSATLGTGRWEVSMHKKSAAIGYDIVVCEFGGSIWRSTDFGDNWTELTDAGTADWSCISYKNGIIYAGVATGALVYSIDDGTNFDTITAAGTANWQSITSSSNRLNPKVYAIAADLEKVYDVSSGAFISTNKLPSEAWIFSATDFSGKNIYLVGDVSAGTPSVYISKDGGNYWTTPSFSEVSMGGVIACSKDGKYVIEPTTNDVYSSNDFGYNMSNNINAPAVTFTSAFIDQTGTKSAMCANADFVYTITDNGETWTQRDVIGSSTPGNWTAITGDLLGTKLAVCANTGYIYTSVDSGVIWTQRDSSRAWSDIANNNDGTKLIACEYGGYIYTSTNSGVAFTSYTSLGTLNFSSVAINYAGTYLYACDNLAVYRSINGGINWETTSETTGNFTSIKCSSDGKIVIVAHLTGVRVSQDYGVTWESIETGGTSAIRKIAINSDASIIYVEANGLAIGKKYTKYNSINSFDTTTTGFPVTGYWSFIVIDTYDGNNIKLVNGGSFSTRPTHLYFNELQYDGYYYGNWDETGQRIIGAIFNIPQNIHDYHNSYSYERSKDYYLINLGNKDNEQGESYDGNYIIREDGILECYKTALCSTDYTAIPSSLYLNGGGVNTYGGTVIWEFPTEFLNATDLIVTSEDEYGSHTYIVAKNKNSVSMQFELGYPNTTFYKRLKAVGRRK